MKTIKVPGIEEVSEASQAIFEQLQKPTGRVSNLYATIGYSSHVLKGMLGFEAEIYRGRSFRAKEREAINLIVSQVNQCDYCLASHTQLAMAYGLTREETITIRKAQHPDKKLNAAILLAKAIAEYKGKAAPQLLENFFDAGYDEAALIELLAIIALRTFTNYVYAATNVPIDFPLAEPID